MRTALANLVAACGIGIVVALAAYGATSTAPTFRYLGPLCATDEVYPGFDPWTGVPYGRSYTYDCPGNEPWEPANPIRIEDMPTELAGRRAIPLPLGFLVGTGIGLAILLLGHRYRSFKPEAEAPQST